MPTAFICTVGTTTSPQNDIVEVLLEDLRQTEAQIVVLLVSPESRANAERIAAATESRQAETEIVELASAQDLDAIFMQTNSIIRSVIARGVQPRDIILNYTSGTKVMSSGAVLAAIFNQVQQLRYIYEAGKGKRELVTTNPDAILAYRDLLLSRRLAFEMRFQSARDLLHRLDASLLNESDKIAAQDLERLAVAYRQWDLFRYASFLETYAEVRKDTPLLRAFFVKDEVLADLQQLASDCASGQYSELILADLINNARRRLREGRIDDAISRTYRALEMLAQYVLQKLDIDTDDLDTRRVPPRYRVNYEAMRSLEDGQVRIGLRRSFELLAILRTDLGMRFEADTELQRLLMERRSSILAHGSKPVSDEDCERLVNAALEMLRAEIPNFDDLCTRVQFPWFSEIHSRTKSNDF